MNCSSSMYPLKTVNQHRLSPIQTSPNWPAPSFLSSLSDDLGISQASFSHGFSGLGFRQGVVRDWQRPSPCSGLRNKNSLTLLCTDVFNSINFLYVIISSREVV